jgi:subtilisin family serine protease
VRSVAVAAVAAIALAGAQRPATTVTAAGTRSDAAAASAAAQVNAQAAWALVGNRTVPPVAVLDSGIDDLHPDLAGKIVAARDFVDTTGDTSDAGWHGTAVAGVTESVCPSCTIVSAKVLDAEDAGDDAEIAQGLLWAVDAGARVANLSMSGPDEAPALRKAIRTATRRGVVIVAAAGNDASGAKSYPAADPNVIGVAATTPSDALYAWSNRGSWVALAAPGNVTTTLRGGGYTAFRGTSAAAPAVAAAAAECLAVSPGLTPAAVRRILLCAAAPTRSPGLARLDVGRAVAACAAS